MAPVWIQLLVLRETGFQISFMLLVLVCIPLGLLYCRRAISLLNGRLVHGSRKATTALWSTGFIVLLTFVLLFALLATVRETNVFTNFSARVPAGRLSIQDFPLIDAKTGRQSEIGQSNHTPPHASPSKENPNAGAYKTTKGMAPGSAWTAFVDAYGAYRVSITVTPRFQQHGVKDGDAAWDAANPAFPPPDSLLEGKTRAERNALIDDWYDDWHERFENRLQARMEQNAKRETKERSRLSETLDKTSLSNITLADFDKNDVQTGKVSFYLDDVDVEFHVYESSPQIFYELSSADHRSETVWYNSSFHQTTILDAQQTYTLEFGFGSIYRESPSEKDSFLDEIRSSYGGVPAGKASIGTVWAELWG